MKHKLIFFLTLALLLNISFAKRTAMLVGIENYEAFAPLENCHGDVDDMKELLKQARFEEDKFWVLKDANYGEFITASKIFTDVNAFARGVDEGDEVIFFFSGHGVGGSDGNNYLLGADGNIDNPEKYSISVEEIKKIIKEKKPAEIVLIVDACRNFIKKEGKGSSQPVESKMNISKGIQVIPTIGTQSQEQSGKTIVKTIFAASEGQQSYERKEKNNGAFTYYMTYLLDSPNSAIDIDGSKDGVITIEDLVLFTDNRINDWTKSQGLPAMNPNYQTEGGITYEPFMLFRYNAEQVVQEQKKEGSKPIFQYDEKAELEKIKKFTEKKEYLTEQLPVYQPKISKAKKIEVDNTDLTSWELALSQEQEIKEAKAEEARKENEAKEKEQIYNDLKNKYNLIITELDNTGDIFEKHEKLEKLRNEVNTVKYPEIKQKILALLEPLYTKIKESKTETQTQVDNLRPQFEKDITNMEKMKASELSEELKVKYFDEFKNKWKDYAKIQKDENLAIRYNHIETKNIVKSSKIGIELVLVLGGSYLMGKNSNSNFPDYPPHSVILNDYYIGKNEVTQKQYESVMAKNPSKSKNDMNPAERVSWYEAIEFCNKLSDIEGLNKCYNINKKKEDPNNFNSNEDDLKYLITFDSKANGYRLPTEAEWEYAARGGRNTLNFIYSGSNILTEVGISGGKPKNICQKKGNELDIFDMSGNVSEWCWDWFDEKYYKNSESQNPTGPKSGRTKAFRGGSFKSSCEVTTRIITDYYPQQTFEDIGFRVVRNVK